MPEYNKVRSTTPEQWKEQRTESNATGFEVIVTLFVIVIIGTLGYSFYAGMTDSQHYTSCIEHLADNPDDDGVFRLPDGSVCQININTN